MSTQIDYDQLAQNYSSLRKASEHIISHVATRLKSGDIKQFAEIGCGTGDHLYALTQVLGGDAHGFDDSKEMLNQARLKYPELRARQGNVDERFPYNARSFGLAFSVNVIHYIKDLEHYFAEARRVLRDGGKVLTVTDSEDDIRNRTMARYFPETIKTDLRRYPSIEMIAAAMRSAGFSDIELTHTLHSYRIDESHLERFRNKASSTLRLIGQNCFDIGVSKMTADVKAGICEGQEVYTYVWGLK
ncbi:methyltransferase domain-containing protein [bacterium]|nr:methyltransferase domain-containing protein [bacterium]